ncbi:MAG TPA: hypothetical protein VGE16_16985 [Albitalea sp.]
MIRNRTARRSAALVLMVVGVLLMLLSPTVGIGLLVFLIGLLLELVGLALEWRNPP